MVKPDVTLPRAHTTFYGREYHSCAPDRLVLLRSVQFRLEGGGHVGADAGVRAMDDESTVMHREPALRGRNSTQARTAVSWPARAKYTIADGASTLRCSSLWPVAFLPISLIWVHVDMSRLTISRGRRALHGDMQRTVHAGSFSSSLGLCNALEFAKHCVPYETGSGSFITGIR